MEVIVKSSFLHLDLLFAAHFIPPQLLLKLLVLIRQDEFVGQVVLIEVVNEVPEALLAGRVSPQCIQVCFEVMTFKHFTDVIEEPTSRLELCRVIGMASTAVATAALIDLPVYLLSNRYLKCRCRNLMAAESAKH